MQSIDVALEVLRTLDPTKVNSDTADDLYEKSCKVLLDWLNKVTKDNN